MVMFGQFLCAVKTRLTSGKKHLIRGTITNISSIIHNKINTVDDNIFKLRTSPIYRAIYTGHELSWGTSLDPSKLISFMFNEPFG